MIVGVDMPIQIDAELEGCFPGLQVLVGHVKDVKVERSGFEMQKFWEELSKQVKQKYSIESVKDVPVFRAYRDFFWRAGIDPTKIRPASEALIRRILASKSVPSINNVVDAYNLASIKTEVALAAFDEDELKGNLMMRFARKGEKFLGIGMQEPMELNGGEIVISDAEKTIAIYPYRDAEQSKISNKTRNVLLLVCGAPGIEKETLVKAGEVALRYIMKFCGGEGKLE